MTHLLSLGEEEELFRATLDTVHVVIHVEEANGQRKAGNDDTVHLTRSEGIARDESDENHLDDGKLGESGYGEARLGSHDLLGGLGLSIHRVGVSGHFYYLLRK
tara:strand:+ start:111 stop:422 length:312 start_codon:yes stop_codon:yes gene_type:complete